ncbi:kinase-like domain-containing protein [Massariosphaeria phaeospora]|uniref:non-specific serine/threonine protein kinase n=1 Tax=Massariosphaeria phaeospora TaxID=100035 RepID=A0A7C8LZX2_9PLEO|nr:kinase-like domain-containing protein [Massariosphaeria phaeospora]
MSTDPWLRETDKPSYQVLKWIGGGGFGQVYKVSRNVDRTVVACKQIQYKDVDVALDEHEHMTWLRGGPNIATVHEELEWNTKTQTLSFFMNYYKGKDLDRQVQVLRGAGEHFTEIQIIEIAYQIATALEYCHRKNILHQDIKPMNVLLAQPWNPLTRDSVPDLYVADFGVASHVQSIGTRMTGPRGTPGYEAPEIRTQDGAAFSQKSDIYAFGCILFRLCTLQDPHPFEVDDVKPRDISTNYSIGLLVLVSSMLCAERDDRPTASEVKQRLMALVRDYEFPNAAECRVCSRLFLSKNKLRIHLSESSHEHNRSGNAANLHEHAVTELTAWAGADDEVDLNIQGAANGQNDVDPSPCAVCMRHFNSKKRFFQHLFAGRHYRNPGFVRKRRSENDFDVVTSKRHRKHV